MAAMEGERSATEQPPDTAVRHSSMRRPAGRWVDVAHLDLVAILPPDADAEHQAGPAQSDRRRLAVEPRGWDGAVAANTRRCGWAA